MNDDLEQWRERSKAKAPSAERWRRAGWIVFWCLVAVAFFGHEFGQVSAVDFWNTLVLAWTLGGVWIALWHLSYWPHWYPAIWQPPAVLALMLLITSIGACFNHTQWSNTLNSLARRCEGDRHWRNSEAGHVCDQILSLNQ